MNNNDERDYEEEAFNRYPTAGQWMDPEEKAPEVPITQKHTQAGFNAARAIHELRETEEAHTTAWNAQQTAYRDEIGAPVVMKNQTFYFTFGVGARLVMHVEGERLYPQGGYLQLGGRYVRVLAGDSEAARDKMNAKYGQGWASMYTEETFADKLSKYQQFDVL
jgi:hypothetical protein